MPGLAESFLVFMGLMGLAIVVIIVLSIREELKKKEKKEKREEISAQGYYSNSQNADEKNDFEPAVYEQESSNSQIGQSPTMYSSLPWKFKNPSRAKIFITIIGVGIFLRIMNFGKLSGFVEVIFIMILFALFCVVFISRMKEIQERSNAAWAARQAQEAANAPSPLPADYPPPSPPVSHQPLPTIASSATMPVGEIFIPDLSGIPEPSSKPTTTYTEEGLPRWSAPSPLNITESVIPEPEPLPNPVIPQPKPNPIPISMQEETESDIPSMPSAPDMPTMPTLPDDPS